MFKRSFSFVSGNRTAGALALALFAGHASAAIINVPADQATIQAAVNAANSGDEIVVANGVYSGPGFTEIDLQGKDLVIRSANGAANTTLDGGFISRAFNITSGQTSATVIDGFTFQNHGDWQFNDNGGAILVQNASPIIRNSVFSGGGALDGGAIAALGTGNVLIENCRFGAPDFVDSGGALFVNGPTVTVSGCEFRDIDLWDISGGDGGAILTTGGELNIVNSIFENNSGGQGGAMRVQSTTVTIVDSVFQGNEGYPQGGAIYVSNSFLDNVENTRFINNRVVDEIGGSNLLGGAVRFTGTASTGSFTDCLFEGNTAINSIGLAAGQARGSAVLAFSPTVSFTDCTFRNNESRGANDGTSIHGAITIQGSAEITVTGCRFEGNVARSMFDPNASAWGAAISLFSSTAELDIDNSEFTGNDGQQGVVYIQGFTGSPRTPATITNSLFENNTTNWGALRIVTSTETLISNCVFRGNSASTSRGALAIQNEDTVSLVENSLFENNSSAASGGGLHIFNALEVTARNCVFDGNTGTSGSGVRIDNTSTVPHATTVLVEGCEFRNNDAGFGAGISSPLFGGSNNIDLTVRDSLFENNTGSWGAGVHIQGFVTDGIDPSVIPAVTIENSTFRNNTTTAGGAALRFNLTADVAVNGSLFEDNNTNGNGGAIWSQGVSGDGIRDTVIRNNNAFLNGGGVFHTGLADISSTLNITNSLIAGNSTEIGGGIYAEGDTTTNLLNVTVAENTAELLANSINADTGADVRLDNSIVWSASGIATEQIAAGFDSEVTANWSNIQGGEASVTGAGTTNWLAGNINADPVFANVAGDDYTLGAGSASVDAGDSSLVSGIDFDLAGNPRVVNAVNYTTTGPSTPAVDHGAYEAPANLPGSGPTCPPDLNGDGVVDADDFFLFLSLFAAGDPRADFNNDGVIDADDFFAFLSAFAAGC